ncbi:MAG: hypothetical protein L0229_22800, partial [Blastocatellia bacterium]|nr:hypothetical protein [Blastocatellia bacterium]
RDLSGGRWVTAGPTAMITIGVTDMLIPDDIVFGPNGRDGALFYGDVRKMLPPERIEALK